MRRLGQFLINGALLCATSVLMRTVGVAFNSYLSTTVGAEGMGLFSLVMSVYSLAVTLSASGISLACTRLTAEALARNNPADLRRASVSCLAYGLLTGGAVAVIQYTLSDVMAQRWLGDVAAAKSLKLLAATLPFVAGSAALDGYFSAVRRVAKTSALRIFEQFFRIYVTIVLLSRIASDDMRSRCFAVVAGSAAADIVSSLVMALLYAADKRKFRGNGIPESRIATAKKVVTITLPVALSSFLRSGLLTIEHLLIPSGLRKFGMDQSAALASYGVLQGMVMPVIFFPSSFLLPYSGLLIPELAEAKEKKHTRSVAFMSSRMIRIALMFSIGCAGIILCFSHELGTVLYGNETASEYIMKIAPLICVMYTDSVIDAMLKGMGEQLFSMKVNIVDALISVLMVKFLVPIAGIDGYVLVIYISEIVNAALSYMRLSSVTELKPRLMWAAGPLICVCLSSYLVRSAFTLMPIDTGSQGMSLAVRITAASVLYAVLLRIARCVSREDLASVKELLCNKKRRAKI